MTNIFFILTLVAVLGVVGSLFAGLFIMAKGGEADKKYANKLMQARIVCQGVAILMFVLALLSAKH